MVTLTNREKRMQVFNIPCRKPRGECPGDDFCQRVETQLVAETQDGVSGTRTVSRRLPGSITLLAGAVAVVPGWVASSPEVKAALDRGALRLLQHTAEATPSPEVHAPAAEDEPPKASHETERRRRR